MTARRLIHSVACALIGLFWTLPVCAAPQQPEEAQVKSAIILNMARYVEWPADTFANDSAPLGICTLGQNKLATAMASLHGKTVKGHPVTVRRMSGSGDLGGCQVIVVDTHERRSAANLVDKVRKMPILTIGDLAGFTQDGGIVELYLHEGKVRFEVNLAAAHQNRLRISSQLLKVARVVRGDE